MMVESLFLSIIVDTLIVISAVSLFPFLFIKARTLFESKLVNKIQSAETAIDAFAYRRYLKIFRIAFVPLFMLLCASFLLLLAYIADHSQNEMGSIFLNMILESGCMGIIFLPFIAFFRKLNGTISLYTREDYLKKNETFILYLRGFSHDDYSSFELLKPLETFYIFSEYHFMACLNNIVPACAIGMTKEYEAPLGATRVYLDDETWQEGVLEMMEKAEMIFVLINNRPSCIWEIMETSSFLDKTVFIVDNAKEYDGVIKQTKSPSFLPVVSNKERFYIMNIHGKATVCDYDNSLVGYKEILSQTGVLKIARRLYEERTMRLMNYVIYAYAAAMILYILLLIF